MKREIDTQAEHGRHGDERRPPEPSEADRPGAQWVLAGVALVVGILGGIALGAILARGDGPLAVDDGDEASSVPTSCQLAIAEARAELDARQTAFDVPSELSTMVERATAAIASVDTAELERILEDLETLVNEARTAAQELQTDEFDEQARACEELAAG